MFNEYGTCDEQSIVPHLNTPSCHNWVRHDSITIKHYNEMYDNFIKCCKEWREITKCPEGKNLTDHLKELMSKLPVA